MPDKKEKKILIETYMRDSPYRPQTVKGHERRLPGQLIHPRERKAGGKTVYLHSRAIQKDIDRRAIKLERLGANRKKFQPRIDQRKPVWLNPDHWRVKPGGGRRFEKLMQSNLERGSKIERELDRWERHSNSVLKEMEDAWK